MKKTKEEEFFERQNKEALFKLKKAGQPKEQRLCPIDGQVLNPLSIMNVEIDQCPKCHGVWLDAGELEAFINDSKRQASHESVDAISEFLRNLFGK